MMNAVNNVHLTAICHVVAMPFPGRGHINPMMNLCKLLASKSQDIAITFVVTEEWLGFIDSDAKPDNLHFASIPNVIPSELVRGAEYTRFYEAVMTKMEVPFDQLLVKLEPPVTYIIADNFLFWAVRVANSRSIPVALLSTESATHISKLLSFEDKKELELLLDLLEKGDKTKDNPAGISSTKLSYLRKIFRGNSRKVRQHQQLTFKFLPWVPKAKYLIFNSVYELEPQAYDSLKTKFSIPIYPIGPAIPYMELKDNPSTAIASNGPNYQEWLDAQPQGSVLYVSLGSYLSVSSDQMEEIAAGLQNSGVRYMWVVRREMKMNCNDMRIVVPWCNQLKVLCHSSVGGIWTHCGWNSILEGLFAGIPFLTFPITFDQIPNSDQIVEDWKVGWRVRKGVDHEKLVTREEIAEIVQKFMDEEESIEVQSMRNRARKFRGICHGAGAKGGSSEKNLDAFIKDISQGQYTN